MSFQLYIVILPQYLIKNKTTIVCLLARVSPPEYSIRGAAVIIIIIIIYIYPLYIEIQVQWTIDTSSVYPKIVYYYRLLKYGSRIELMGVSV